MSLRSFNSPVIRKNEDNNIKQRYYSTHIYSKIENSSSDLYIITRRGDRLDLLASEFYGDTRYWKLLANVNNIGKGTFNVTEGTKLRIPSIDRIRDIERDMMRYNNDR